MTSVSSTEGRLTCRVEFLLPFENEVRDDGMEKTRYGLTEEPISIVLKFVFIHCHRESGLDRRQSNYLVF